MCFDRTPALLEDNGYNIITCAKCNLSAHKRCIGENSKEIDMEDFKCLKCRSVSQIKSNP